MKIELIKLNIVIFSVIFSTKVVQAESIKIGIIPNYAPFSHIDSKGDLIGFDVDITNALCRSMDVDCEIVSLIWDDLIPAVQVGKIDAIISSMNDTPERKKKVTFSSKYYHNPVKMVKPVNEPVDFNAQDLRGKTVGVQKNSTADDHITSVFGSVVSIMRYDDSDSMYKELTDKKIDFIANDSLAMKKEFLDKPNGTGYHFFGPGLSDPTYYGTGAAVAVKLGNHYLADRFSKAIASIREDKTYFEISNKYFEEDVYGF